MSLSKNKPLALYVLVFLLFFLGISAMYGGLCLVIDPTGGLLKMGDEVLVDTPFNSFILPGLVLAIVLGIIPLSLIYPLLTRPDAKWPGKLNLYRSRHWAWTYSLYVGIVVIIWIDVQIVMIGYSQVIQTVIAAIGVLIVIFTVWPSVMNYFESSSRNSTEASETATDQ